MAKNFSVYQMVTDRIITMLDNGIIPWRQPWTNIVRNGNNNVAYSRATGKPYSLINQWLLGRPGEYATFEQIKKDGGMVNKGAKSREVVFWKMLQVTETNDEGEEVKKTIPLLRYYRVFHISDTNLEPKKREVKEQKLEPNAEAERILTEYWTAEGIKVQRDKHSQHAYYNPGLDYIRIPKLEQYKDVAEYYSTAFHESAHSTGHPKRLNRIASTAFASIEYSKEELVAEISAAALCNMVGIETDKSFENSVAYIQNWRNAIARDNKLVISAAGKAEKAIDRILNPQTI